MNLVTILNASGSNNATRWITIDRVPTSKSCVFCIGIDSFFPTFDIFLVPSCWKDYFLETKVFHLVLWSCYGTSVFCFHFIINSAGFEKNSVVFFSFVVRFRLVILFYSYFSICWLDFFPNIRFSNRSDYSIALSLSLRIIWSFLVLRIVCFTWKTFLCWNWCFTSFSSLNPYINAPHPPRLMQCIKFSFSLTAGARQ